jgi:SRSO17 transposase
LVWNPTVAGAPAWSQRARSVGLAAQHLQYMVDIHPTLGVWTTPGQPVACAGRGRPPKPQYFGPRPQSVATVAAGLPARARATIRWREGTKGWLQSRFAATRVQPAHGHAEGAPEQPVGWLLVEWPARAPAPTK